MALKHSLNNLTKTYLIILIAVVTVTSIKVQTASAFELLPTPVISTAMQMADDAIQTHGFVIPERFDAALQPAEDIPKYNKNYVVTAFNSVPWQTDASPCISADGSDICKLKDQGEQSCAAALPFGTKINIPGFGTCTVHDRLAPRFSSRIDLYFGGADQLAAAKQWGKRHLEVQIMQTI